MVIRYFKIAAPVVDALNTPIAAALAPKKKGALRAEVAQDSCARMRCDAAAASISPNPLQMRVSETRQPKNRQK